ncbi:tyrosine-type recombinase/integrase [Streptomyces lydicus]
MAETRSAAAPGRQRAARVAGRLGFHNLRHTRASLLHKQGTDARMIMEVLGHSSIRMTTDIYTFVRLDSLPAVRLRPRRQCA